MIIDNFMKSITVKEYYIPIDKRNTDPNAQKIFAGYELTYHLIDKSTRIYRTDTNGKNVHPV